MMNSLSRICVRRAASAAAATTVRQQPVHRAWLSSGSVTVRKDTMLECIQSVVYLVPEVRAVNSVTLRRAVSSIVRSIYSTC
jgi:hypothetical protein